MPLTEVATADISGQIILNVTITSAGIVDLDQVDIPLTEYIPQVYDYFTFKVNYDGKTVTLTAFDQSKANTTDIVIPAKVDLVDGVWQDGNTYTVTVIADGGSNTGVFEDSGITSVTFPSSLTSIGGSAFSYCDGLTSLTLPSSLKSIEHSAFYSCSGLTGELNLGECTNLTSIGIYAFDYCSKLTSISLPSSLTSIGSFAFERCSGLTGTVTIPASVTSIGDNPFADCSNLEGIAVEEGNSGYYIEGNCLIESSTKTLITGFNNSTIPSDIKIIGDWAFYDCSGLTGELNLGGCTSLTSIGSYAFSYCDGLTSLTLPSSLQNIGKYAFSICNNIEMLEYQGTLEQYLSIDMDTNWMNDKSHTFILNGAEITSLVVPEGITEIPADAFYGCTDIQNLTLPSSLETIGYEAFSNCSGLTSVDLSGCTSLTSIGEDAFSYCSGLTSLTLPSSLTSIEDGVFNNCDSITKLEYLGTLEQWLAINMGSLWIDDTSHSLVINGESLRNLVVPDGITTIPQCAFYGCSFSNISLPSSLQSIENSVFNYCSYSTFEFRGTIEQWLLIEIGDNMTNDLTHTFIANGEEITNLVIPEGITIISNYAFTGCTNITNITMPSTLQSIDYWAFAYCRGITNIDFSACENLKTIENSAFVACSDQLSSLDLSNCKNLTNIGMRAFEGCYALTDVNLIGCANLISIDRYAFSNCRGLINVNLSGCTNLTSIGSDAFFYCIALKSVVFPEGSTGWYVTQEETATSGTPVDVTNASTNASNLTGQYRTYYWKRG